MGAAVERSTHLGHNRRASYLLASKRGRRYTSPESRDFVNVTASGITKGRPQGHVAEAQNSGNPGKTAKPRHLSAEDIYRQLLETGEDIGLATVYRVLTQFETAGLVTRHNFEGGHSVFEMDDGEHHDHMVCIETGEVVEFTNDEIERIQKDIAKSHNFRADRPQPRVVCPPDQKGIGRLIPVTGQARFSFCWTARSRSQHFLPHAPWCAP